MFNAAGFLWRTEETIYHHQDGTSLAVEPRFEISAITEQPAGLLTVWRGAPVSTGGRGMSWTLHRECAADFARVVLHVEPAVYRAVVPSRAVLAVFGDTREQEVVMNPHMLRGRIVVDERLPITPLEP
jgi:hypothetical protein